jgi:hypothetical protein
MQEMHILKEISNAENNENTNIIKFHDIYLYKLSNETLNQIDIKQYFVIVMELGEASLEEILKCRIESEQAWS